MAGDRARAPAPGRVTRGSGRDRETTPAGTGDARLLGAGAGSAGRPARIRAAVPR